MAIKKINAYMDPKQPNYVCMNANYAYFMDMCATQQKLSKFYYEKRMRMKALKNASNQHKCEKENNENKQLIDLATLQCIQNSVSIRTSTKR